MNRWWAIMTKPQREERVSLYLGKKGLGLNTFWPHVSDWEGTSKTKSRLVKRSWLSRYLFVEAPRDKLYLVHSDRARDVGVSTLICAAGDEPFPIHDAVMKNLLDKADPLGEVYRPGLRSRRFQGRAGDLFRFSESSPFWGFAAEVIKVLDNDTIIAKFQQTLFGASGREVVVPIADVSELQTGAKNPRSRLTVASSGAA